MLSGDVITVYENACSVCQDEPYTVKLVSNGACVTASSGCNVFALGSGNGTTKLSVPASAF